MSFFSSIFRTQMPDILQRLKDVRADLDITQDNIRQLINLEQDIAAKSNDIVTKNEKILERAVGSFGVAMWVKDTESRFLYANKQCCETVLKCAQEEALGLKNGDFKKDMLAQICMQSDQKVIFSQTTRRFIEYATMEDGEQFWIDTLKSPVFDSKGRLIQIMGSAIDITDSVPDALKQSHGKTGSIEIPVDENLCEMQYIKLLERRAKPRKE